MRVEEPSWAGPFFGQFGVLADDGDRVQCHVCGGMFDHLGSHTNRSHGLTADQYRQAFGLMQSTKLIGPTFRAKRSAISAEHLRQYNDIHHGRTRNLTPEQCVRVVGSSCNRRPMRGPEQGGSPRQAADYQGPLGPCLHSRSGSPQRWTCGSD